MIDSDNWWDTYKKATPLGQAYMCAAGRWISEHPGVKVTPDIIDGWWKDAEAAQKALIESAPRHPNCALSHLSGLDVVTKH